MKEIQWGDVVESERGLLQVRWLGKPSLSVGVAQKYRKRTMKRTGNPEKTDV